MKWIISNHKNALAEENVSEYIEELNKLKVENIKLVICPADKHLGLFKGTNYALGSQDIKTDKTIDELKNNSIKYVLVGHSDVRREYQETDEEINRKLKLLIKENMYPILCIGEEVDSNIKDVLDKQLEKDLKNIKETIIIAYEPIWAISSGIIPKIEDLKDIIDYIDRKVTLITGNNPIVLYGGSVNEETIKELKKVETLDGYLIGNASLSIKSIKKIINIISK